MDPQCDSELLEQSSKGVQELLTCIMSPERVGKGKGELELTLTGKSSGESTERGG